MATKEKIQLKPMKVLPIEVLPKEKEPELEMEKRIFIWLDGLYAHMVPRGYTLEQIEARKSWGCAYISKIETRMVPKK